MLYSSGREKFFVASDESVVSFNWGCCSMLSVNENVLAAPTTYDYGCLFEYNDEILIGTLQESLFKIQFCYEG